MMEEQQSDRISAVALSHSASDMTPIVVAKGYGVVAESIVRIARESGLYVHSSPELVKLLLQVDLDARIPPELYVAVAEVLAWLHKLENSPVAAEYRDAMNRLGPDRSPH